MPNDPIRGGGDDAASAQAEVHRAFGQAFATAQRLENNVVTLIVGLGGVDYHDVHSARGHIVALRGLTMGDLVGEVERLAEVAGHFQDEALLPTLDAAVDLRNQLAHGFFVENLVETCTVEGCRDLVRELVEIDRRLAIVSDQVVVALRGIPGLTYVENDREAEVLGALVTGGRSQGYEAFMKRFTALPRTVEVTNIYVAESKGLTESGYRPILAMSDHRLLTIGAYGLCAFVEDAPVVLGAEFDRGNGEWTTRVGVPCKVRTKVKLSMPWHYDVPLAGGWRLEVRPGGGDGALFKWTLLKSE